jgi:fibronectin-binding autotransporter adhesin
MVAFVAAGFALPSRAVTTVNSGMTLTGDTTTITDPSIIDNGTVDFNQSFDGTYAGVISSTGDVVKDGAGDVTFSGANTYTGTTTINAGTLSLSNPDVTANNVLSGNILDDASLVSSGNMEFAGAISGSGALNVTGGVTTLLGSNSYAGGTNITGGILTLGNGVSAASLTGALTVGSAGRVTFFEADLSAVTTITSSGALFFWEQHIC